jgi:hypothetical protein
MEVVVAVFTVTFQDLPKGSEEGILSRPGETEIRVPYPSNINADHCPKTVGHL